MADQASIARAAEKLGLPIRLTQIVILVTNGKTNKEIAYDLGISAQTVKNHIGKIFQKLGVSSRVEIAHQVLLKLETSAHTGTPTERPKRVVRQKPKGPIDPSTGRKIRRLRVAHKMIQKDLAGDDFSKGFISLVETGRTRLSLRSAEIFATRLGVSVAALLPQRKRAKLNLPPGLDGRIQEALTLLSQASQFSSSAFAVMLEISPDYAVVKSRLKKIEQLVKSAPAPLSKDYATWLTDLVNALTEPIKIEEKVRV